MVRRWAMVFLGPIFCVCWAEPHIWWIHQWTKLGLVFSPNSCCSTFSTVIFLRNQQPTPVLLVYSILVILTHPKHMFFVIATNHPSWMYGLKTIILNPQRVLNLLSHEFPGFSHNFMQQKHVCPWRSKISGNQPSDPDRFVGSRLPGPSKEPQPAEYRVYTLVVYTLIPSSYLTVRHGKWP